jgi:catechol 2,3-dioxygenase-like lactoylglutathione lyase family enzyme
MSTIMAHAVVCTADPEKAKAWYGQLFGRKPDRTPMAEVHEWYFGDGVGTSQPSHRSKISTATS